MTIRQPLELTIRPPAAADAEPVAALVRDSFARRYGAGDGEAALIAQLRSDRDVAAELAAFEEGRLAGHVLFSRATCDPPGTAIAALAPMAVRHDTQGRGIGAALVRAGLEACARQGFDAVIVLGDPAYYGRFGFHVAEGIESPYAGPHFQALELRAGALARVRAVAYPQAFGRTVG
jgi:putative acetyltransferase